MEVDIYCPMTFESYPIDSHICYFMLGSYSYDENILNFTLNQLEFDVKNQVSLLDYFIKVRPLSRKYQRLKHGYGALQHKRTGSGGSGIPEIGFLGTYPESVEKWVFNAS